MSGMCVFVDPEPTFSMGSPRAFINVYKSFWPKTSAQQTSHRMIIILTIAYLDRFYVSKHFLFLAANTFANYIYERKDASRFGTDDRERFDH